MTTWSENRIASALAEQTFQRKAIVITPNCNWTGYECDLLVVTKELRIIDVEIKISRADLRADASKSKWWHREFIGYGPDEGLLNRHGVKIGTHRPAQYNETLRPWPLRVWKHYYAMPAEVWHEKLLDALPSPNSGVIALRWKERRGYAPTIVPTVVRRATPNRGAHVLTPAQAIDIARLTNLRYWGVRENLERTRALLDEALRTQAGEAAA